MTKTFIKGALVAAVAVVATPALANPADFTATATIQKPLAVTKDADLDFGTTIMNPTLSSDTVTVDKTSGAIAVCGSAQLTCAGGAPAAFTVNGVGTQTVTLGYGTPISTLDDGAGNTVGFSLDAPSSVDLTNGVGTFNVGGSITVVAATKAGVYTGDLQVTASYQ